MSSARPHPDFHRLTYDVVIRRVEDALGVRCTNLCRPMNSYINRVYEVQTAEGEPVIAKFYRPGRWSREALQDEHDLLLELHEQEIPVIPPLGEPGQTLREADGAFFALFPKKGGRICDEPSPDQWRELGRLLGRVHLVCAAGMPRDRITLTPECATADQVEFILDSGLVAEEQFEAYESAAYDMLDLIEPLFAEVRLQRIHGDLHRQNLIYRPGETFYLIDFDDMAVGPAVQDIWMLLPGRAADAGPELDWLRDGYETFRPFARDQLRLIEPLRAMRFIHFTAWCARQAADGGFARLAPGWGTPAYWRQEVGELRRQEQDIRDAGDV